MAETQAAVAMVLPDAEFPGPIAATSSVSAHSRVLSAEQIARARSSPHLGLLCSLLRGSQERSQSGATSSVAQPIPRPLDGGCEGSGESGH